MIQGEDGCVALFALAIGLPFLAELLAGAVDGVTWAVSKLRKRDLEDRNIKGDK